MGGMNKVTAMHIPSEQHNLELIQIAGDLYYSWGNQTGKAYWSSGKTRAQ